MHKGCTEAFSDGVVWNNHHHMLRAADRINGGIRWADLH